MFRGRYQHSIDPKGRLSVPARFREALAQLGENSDQLVVVPNEHALEVHPLGDWQRIEEKLNAQPMFTPEVRQLSRLYMSRAKDVTLDNVGRVLLPARHAQGGGPGQGGHAGRRRAPDVRGVGPRRASRSTSARTATRCRRCSTSCPGTESSGSRSCPRRRGRVSLCGRDSEGWVVDGTVGMGGHAEALLETSGSGVRLLGLDADPEALRQAGARLARFGARARLVHASFANLGAVAADAGRGRGAGDPARPRHLLLAARRVRPRLLLPG